MIFKSQLLIITYYLDFSEAAELLESTRIPDK